ncbi:MAG TPA: tripartite tricarboxylate transporter permease [Anaerolineae bacterium]|nr:tripartite tricarboxylate transporter permease [Anaerolineae bacterium]HPL28532.1 tripartite tricarboxylate transporter permease [Anaerolineae bacterium]
MFDAFFQAVALVFSPAVFAAMFVGTVIAVVVGILPGLGGPAIIIMALPFVAGRDPLMCLAFMIVLQTANTTGGALTSILIGVPGESSNAPLLLDGFPMTRKGQAARAIGASLTSSVMGGTASVLFAFLMIPFVMPLLMELRSPELFAVILVGLTFLAVLTQGSPIKGLISAGLGILFSCIGFQAKTGLERFTFGNPYLYDGITIVVMLMGLLAVPVLIELASANKPIAEKASPIGAYRELLSGVRDVFAHWWLWLRATVIGYLVGVIPGIGGETAIWAAYAHGKQTSKHPETFGTGNVEGVIAPQSAANARAAGDLLTTLALGIPGNSSMVLIMAALIMLGIQPGPKMLTEHTSLSFALLLITAQAEILGAGLCILALPVTVKITRVSPHYLFCLIVPLVCVGVYVYNNSFLDLVVMVAITIVGILLRKFKYSIPSLILGFIMGRLFEYYLWQSIDFRGPLFFMTPISLALLFVVFLVLTKDVWSGLWRRFRRPTMQGVGAK